MNKENEYLARMLFGKKAGTPCWTLRHYPHEWTETPQNREPDFLYKLDKIDYTEHWQQVVEKLMEKFTTSIKFEWDCDYVPTMTCVVSSLDNIGCWQNDFVGEGKSWGEALCKAAVKLIKSTEQKGEGRPYQIDTN